MMEYFYFLNRKNNGDGFKESVTGKIFVDKSELIGMLNEKISTKEKWICLSRPRRFGKTTALEMLSAYYTRGIDSDPLFQGLKIKEKVDYYKHLNAHNVIIINFNDYFEDQTVEHGLLEISRHMIHDLKQAYPEAVDESGDLVRQFDRVEQITGEKFIFLIDEWDCVFRFHKGKKKEQESFLSFLRLLLKDKSYVELAYMTGILPIKKYNTGSALNMFREYTMLEPKKLTPFFGFTEDEIRQLCIGCPVPFYEEIMEWYDGYHMPEVGGICNPCSVVQALEENVCRDYWNKTGGFSELEEYITMDFDGLGQAITELIAGENVRISVLGFSNDLDSFRDKDEVLTALIHLGYLTYKNGCVKIPNKEIREEFSNTVKKLSWGTVSSLLRQSKNLLDAVLEENEQKVAEILEDVHDGMQEFKEYNNEHTLKCVIHLAFYAAADDYTLKFENPSGKGYADCIMFPKTSDKPGIVLELKYNRTAEEALDQIKERDYVKAFDRNIRKVLLVGINYDKKTKKHQCLIDVSPSLCS